MEKILENIKYKIKKMYYKLKYNKVEFGYSVNFRNNFRVSLSDKARLKIGDGCFFNNDCSINVKKSVEIGKNCIFGENVKIYDHNHKFNRREKKIKDQGYSCAKIEIGDNCWIGSNAIILKGAKIGNNVVVSAGAIISSEIPSDVIVKNEKKYEIEKITYIDE